METVYLLNNKSTHFLLISTRDYPWSTFFLCEFACAVSPKWTHTVLYFCSLYHLAYFQVLSLFICIRISFPFVAEEEFIICLYHILFICGWILELFPPFGCCIRHWPTNIWVSLLIILGIYLRVELLGHMIILYLAFWGTIKLLSTVAALFYSSTSSKQEFQFLCIFIGRVNLLSFFFFKRKILAALVYMKKDVIMVLIGIPLWPMMLKIFLCAYWPFYIYKWRNVYSGPLTIF